MSDKSNEDQDHKPDQNPAAADTSAVDVDALIAAEDPEFLARVNSIKIDSTQVALDIESSVDVEGHIHQGMGVYLKRSVEFKTNPKPVTAFWAVFAVAVILLGFAWLNKSNLLHQELFLTSFEKLGGAVNTFNPITDMEPFYDNPRFPKNIMSMSSVQVNLKPSDNSGENPMLAFEVSVEGMSTDAIIEIKDRQAEFKDMLARLAEQKTYDELVVAEGKRALCDQYRDILNANLTRGQIRRVLLKTFVIKP